VIKGFKGVLDSHSAKYSTRLLQLRVNEVEVKVRASSVVDGKRHLECPDPVTTVSLSLSKRVSQTTMKLRERSARLLTGTRGIPE
jgi:hypothetical protein